MIEGLNKLNPMQREAALHKDGPLLILAGAGSGKTSTMTIRIAHLIEDEGVSPYNILAVTFTNKAAAEMRERIEALVGSKANRMWIFTFHACCLRILRRDADRLGYKPDFAVYDTTDQKVVIKRGIKEFSLDEKKYAPNYVLSIISKAKEKSMTATDYQAAFGQNPQYAAVAKIYTYYEEVLKRNNAMDFDDLIFNAVRLLRGNQDVLAYYQERFKYIMVDEYQDTNALQYQFVKMLSDAHDNLCVVGDDDQCIYQWRGADIRNILDFEHDFKDTKVIKLEQNYRSHKTILDAANSVIKNNTDRKSKKLWTDAEDGEKVSYRIVDNEKDEARYIAREITSLVDGIDLNSTAAKLGASWVNSSLLDGGREYRDMAILYRTNAQSRALEEALIYSKIPYKLVGGVRYYDRKEIKDMMSYMRLIINPDDDLALMRIINEPKRGMGAKTLEKLEAWARSQDKSILNLLQNQEVIDSLSAKSQPLVKQMVEAITKYSSIFNLNSNENQESESDSDSLSLDDIRLEDMYDDLLVSTGYLKGLEVQETVESEGRIENLMEFKTVIAEYEKGEEANGEVASLSGFLEKVALVADVDNYNQNEDAVTLMTIHSAKGLEFPVVFLAGMEDGLFPTTRSMEAEDGIEEERRLCYVGMTRAKEKLYLLRAKGRTIYGRYNRMLESRFLKEVDVNTFDKVAMPGQDETGMFHGAMGGEDGRVKPGASLGGMSSSNLYGSDSTNTKFATFNSASSVAKKIKTSVAGKNAASGDLHVAKGDKVRHAKFGEGLVMDTDEKTITVMFDSEGKKKLAKGFAPLTKI
ncbi:MAG: UvrD-helicase domain-containing protein [Clostridiales Family XIII bacterium]|nr:UvrD-helicase domain-containing protein [Clostridiales Family XIII bacterium]